MRSLLASPLLLLFLVYPSYALANPTKLCVELRQSVAPSNGATRIEGNAAVSGATYRLRAPVIIDTIQVNTVIVGEDEFSWDYTANFVSANDQSALAFARAFATKYSLVPSPGIAGKFESRRLSVPFEVASIAVHGPKIMFRCVADK